MLNVYELHCTCICVRFAVNGLAYTTKSLLYILPCTSYSSAPFSLAIESFTKQPLNFSLSLRSCDLLSLYLIWIYFSRLQCSGIYLIWSEATAFEILTIPNPNYKHFYSTHTHTAHRIPHTHTNEKSIFFDRRISNSAQKFPRFHSKTRQITDFQYDCCKRQCRIHAYSYMCMCICVCDPFNIEMTLRFCFSFQRVMKLFGGFYSDLFLVNSNQLNTDGYMPLKWKCL